MTQKERRAVEVAMGMGEVLQGAKLVSMVHYSLQVDREYLLISSWTGRKEIPIQTLISGQITVLEGERNFPNVPMLTLRLADRRAFDFYVTRVDSVSGIYQIANAPGDGL